MRVKASKIDNYPQILTFAFFAFWLKYILRIKVQGIEEISVEKPAVFVANHRSKLDPFVILSALGWRNFLKFYPWRFPLAKDLAKKWWLKFPAWFVGCYKIEGKGDLEKSLKETLELIDRGYSMIYFPEGKMVREGELVEPKKGIGYICAKKDVNILPVKIEHGGFDYKGRGKDWKSKVVFGEVFTSKNMRNKEPVEEMHRVIMKEVYELQ